MKCPVILRGDGRTAIFAGRGASTNESSTLVSGGNKEKETENKLTLNPTAGLIQTVSQLRFSTFFCHCEDSERSEGDEAISTHWRITQSAHKLDRFVQPP